MFQETTVPVSHFPKKIMKGSVPQDFCTEM